MSEVKRKINWVDGKRNIKNCLKKTGERGEKITKAGLEYRMQFFKDYLIEINSYCHSHCKKTEENNNKSLQKIQEIKRSSNLN